MKLINWGKAVLAALLVSFSVNAVKAQSPDAQFGVGIVMTEGIFGGQLQYAVTPAFHIGTQFGFQAISQGSNSTNDILFAPYGKFLFMGTPTFKPFIQGQFVILNSGGSSSSGLNLAGGAEYFANRNLGIFGGITVLSLGLNPAPTRTVIGLGGAFLGVEWFF